MKAIDLVFHCCMQISDDVVKKSIVYTAAAGKSFKWKDRTFYKKLNFIQKSKDEVRY